MRYPVNFNQADTGAIVISTNNSGIVAWGNGNSYCRLQIIWRLTTGVLDLSLLRILPVIVKRNDCSITIIQLQGGIGQGIRYPERSQGRSKHAHDQID